MRKMILGTVQLGMNYGINNQSGMPEKSVSNQILGYAYDNSVRCLDTASAYGVSEQIIGEFIKATGKQFAICTKLAVELDEYNIDEELKGSIERLSTKNIYLLYLHRFEQCKNKKLMQRLVNLKLEGIIKNIGISIYEPKELEYIINKLSGIVNYVQIPFNLLDNARWLDNDLLLRARNTHISIATRSVYLQGLFFLDEENLKKNKVKAYDSVMMLREIAKQNHMSVAQLAVNFVNSFEEIGSYLLGVETLEQLKDNIIIDNNISILSNDILEQIYDISRKVDANIIDPRKWS